MIGGIRSVAGIAVLLAACGHDASTNANTSTGDAAPIDAGGDGGPSVALDPDANADPADLDPVNGDPSLDIASSRLFFDAGAPWVRVTFYGAWPPLPAFYSWGCSILLGTENAPTVTYSRQSDGGQESDLVDGVDASKITYVEEATGFRVRIGDATLKFDRYAVQCSLQKTTDSPPVDDASGAFVIATKTERPFGG